MHGIVCEPAFLSAYHLALLTHKCHQRGKLVYRPAIIRGNSMEPHVAQKVEGGYADPFCQYPMGAWAHWVHGLQCVVVLHAV